MDQITTERLVIRPISMHDLNDICEYGTDEEIGRYMLHWPKSKEQITELIKQRILEMSAENPKRYEYSIHLKSNYKTIGNITLNIKDDIAEIGWLSNKNFWNKGYMSEAVKEVIQFTFESLSSINRIIATCSEKNIASYRVMEKCGMQRIAKEENFKSSKGDSEVTYTKLTYCSVKP